MTLGPEKLPPFPHLSTGLKKSHLVLEPMTLRRLELQRIVIEPKMAAR